MQDGYKIIFVDNPQWGVRAAEFVLKDSQVSQLHAQLPNILLALGTQVERYIPGGAVDCTLHHYDNPVRIPDGRGGTRVVRSIFAVTPSDHNLFVGLSVETYDLNEVIMKGQSITVAGSGYNDKFLFSSADFEAIFPGWETRYSVAKELGYLGKQLAEVVCAAQPTTSAVDVTPIVFD